MRSATLILLIAVYGLLPAGVAAADDAATPAEGVQQGQRALLAGDHATAIPRFRRALAALDARRDPEPYRQALLGLATALLRAGQPGAAREQTARMLALAGLPPLLQAVTRQLRTITAAMASDHPQTVDDADAALAAFARLPGDAHRAATLQLRLFKASALAEMARLPEAVALQRDALEQAVAVFGEHAPETMTTLDTLAGFHLRLGDTVAALRVLRRLLALQSEALGTDSVEVQATRSRVALFESTLPAPGTGLVADDGARFVRTVEAGVLGLSASQRQLDAALATHGPEHLMTAGAWVGYGLARTTSDPVQARDAFARALAIFARVHGDGHILSARTRRHLARTYTQDPVLFADPAASARAAALLVRALADFERMLGPSHPDTLDVLRDLYRLHQGDNARAHGYASRAYRALLEYESRVLPYLATPQRLAFRQQYAPFVDDYFYAVWTRTHLLRAKAHDLPVADSAHGDPSAAPAAAGAEAERERLQHAATVPVRELLAAWLDRKGQISAAENSLQLALRSTVDAALTTALRETLAARAAIGAGQQALADRPADWEALRADIATHRDTIARHEPALLAAFPQFGVDREIDIGAVAAALPAGALYIDFARLTSNEYFLFTVDPRGAVALWRLVPELEGEDTIDQRVRALRGVLDRILDGELAARGSERRIKRLAGQLFDDLLLPIRQQLADHDELVISPDGLLGLLPFGLLFDARAGKYLAETHGVRHIPSARELLRHGPGPGDAAGDARGHAPGRGPLRNSGLARPTVVMADPAFDLAGAPAARGCPSGEPTRSAVQALLGYFGEPCIPRLPATAVEAASIAAILGAGVQVFTGTRASESVLAAQRRPDVLHIATHGFFLADPGITNPLEKSGLVLSGANDAIASGGGEGIVNGLDLAGLDLAGTRLVVLSACETGVGDVQQGEGIAGLNQALIRAGARGVVMSLWRVPDAETAELMRRLYGALASGQTPAGALNTAQRSMIRDGAHPLAWAAFIYSGR